MFPVPQATELSAPATWPTLEREPQASPVGFGRSAPPVGADQFLPPSTERDTPGIESTSESAKPATIIIRSSGLLAAAGSTCRSPSVPAFWFTRAFAVNPATDPTVDTAGGVDPERTAAGEARA